MLLQLQDRIKELVQADPYFAGVEVITQRQGDLVKQVVEAVGKLSFMVVVSMSSGEASEDSAPEALLDERLDVEIFQNPLLDGQSNTRNLVEATEKVITAVHMQPFRAAGRGTQRFWLVSHQAFYDAGGPSSSRLTFKINLLLKP